jgi:glutathione S-transferase
MPIDFYYILASPPCRSVMLVAKALNIELNLKVTELSKGDNKTPEFLKVQYEILVLHVLPGKQIIHVNYYFCMCPKT